MSGFKMKRMPFVCRDTDVCALRGKFAYLFNQFLDDFSIELPYLRRQVSAQVVYDILLQHNSTTVNFLLFCLNLWLCC